jgi:hypothetical protein
MSLELWAQILNWHTWSPSNPLRSPQERWLCDQNCYSSDYIGVQWKTDQGHKMDRHMQKWSNLVCSSRYPRPSALNAKVVWVAELSEKAVQGQCTEQRSWWHAEPLDTVIVAAGICKGVLSKVIVWESHNKQTRAERLSTHVHGVKRSNADSI